jgi:hypothetical protein
MDLGKKQLLSSFIYSFVPLIATVLLLWLGLNWYIVIISIIILFITFLFSWGIPWKKMIIGIIRAVLIVIIILFLQFLFENLKDNIVNSGHKESFIITQLIGIVLLWTIFYELFFRKLFDIKIIKYIFRNQSITENKWTSIKTVNEQNTDYREINLRGQLLKKVEFEVKPLTDYWRAGIKICSPNCFILPLRSDKSLLIHLGSINKYNDVGMSVYVNGESKIHKSGIVVVKDKPILLRLEVNSKNFLTFFINDNVEFEERIDSDLFKKLYLAAWTDGNEGSVEFNNISYTLR